MSAERRHAHREFDAALIEGYLRGRRVDSIQRFAQGKSNSNYKLTVDGELCVLRLHSTEHASRERAAMRLAANIVPVPTLLAAGTDWSLLSYVEGEHLTDHPECIVTAARIITKVWSIRFDGQGWVNIDGGVTPFDFNGEADFGTAVLKNPDVQQWLGSEAITSLTEILRRAPAGPAGSRSGGCLVHGDYNPSNVLVRNGEVVALLDWEFAHSGDPFMDISNLVRHTPPAYHEWIRQGVQSSGMQLPDDWLRRCEFDHLGSYLEFLTTGRADSFKRQCADWILDFVKRHERRTQQIDPGNAGMRPRP